MAGKIPDSTVSIYAWLSTADQDPFTLARHIVETEKEAKAKKTGEQNANKAALAKQLKQLPKTVQSHHKESQQKHNHQARRSR
jgi:hypothetical protein